jgi:hypothetical protein
VGLGDSTRWGSAEEVFAGMAREVHAFSGLSYRTLTNRGAPLSAAAPSV